MEGDAGFAGGGGEGEEVGHVQMEALEFMFHQTHLVNPSQGLL
jgi:hypothetical protein